MWCRASMSQCPRIHSASWLALAWVTVRLVTAQTVTVRHFLLASGRMRRVTQIAWAAWGKASPAVTVTALSARRSSRPWPRLRCRARTGICRQGRFLSWACRPGWFFLTMKM